MAFKQDLVALSVTIDDERITVALADGRSISVPTEWYPRLAHATPAERDKYELLGHGSASGWPDLDERLSVENPLGGRSSRESRQSLRCWLATRNA